MRHDYMTSKDCGCDDPYCNICVAGLALCKVCDGAEGWLTTDCPGEVVPYETGERVGRGELDYINGAWVEKGKAQ